MLPYQEYTVKRSSDGDETLTSCCTHARGGFGNLKIKKIVLAGVPGVALQEHTPFILLRRNFQKLL